MKTRLGFVSNSSSCSFVCDLTGEVKSGWSWGIEDVGMYGCINGHRFNKEYVLNPDKIKVWARTIKHKANPDGFVDYRELPASFCPICQMKEILAPDLAIYLRTEHPDLYTKIKEEIRDKFKTYKQFKKAYNLPAPRLDNEDV